MVTLSAKMVELWTPYENVVHGYAEINVKKLQFIHMLTATDLRSSHIENSKNKKVILLYHCTSSYVNVQQYSKITFLCLLFSMCEGLSPLICDVYKL